MREIKFRGKRLDNGEWVIGDLFQPRGGVKEIVAEDASGHIMSYPVDPATVGQFMGILDKTANEIWEGSIMEKVGNKDGEVWDGHDKGHRSVASMDQFPVCWLNDEGFGYEGEDLEFPGQWVVIGKIHDNPELLKTE